MRSWFCKVLSTSLIDQYFAILLYIIITGSLATPLYHCLPAIFYLYLLLVML